MSTYVKETVKTRSEAIQAIEASLQQAKFGVLWNFDLSAKLEEKGVQPPAPYTILEVCNPSIAANVLNENLLVGAFLPCKIVVFEEDETVKIAMPLPTKLMEGFGDERILAAAKEVEQQLITCIDEAAE
ncbi:DUF302 domain-containing protein [Sporosarcina gallistercoris]|uniref:DUF302 domain-containing protein n=1 Tax=Sporosarcina gallistercoris TaxID=2762245 RepID=A0ABR8PMH9_9BACL|nr:DUF302 domain-containing protein [Sporosarcina gallistercoris]MBD7909352.1 DUF302 domain-containing protein [Sporosarcina gallistercoris]